MSEFLAEARVLIRPDTTGFAATLKAELAAIAKASTITIPVLAGSTAGAVAATRVTQDATAAQIQGALAAKSAAAAERELAAATAHRASQQAFAARGAGATALSLLGVRGATLAANASFLAGAAALVVFAKSVGLAAKLEDELNVFRITAGATAEEMERVSEAARALGTDITLPAVSAGDAAAAMTELAKAGLSVQDSIAGARGTLQLATAAQLDNATAVNITASALNAFGLSGSEAVHVADLLANAANEAQGGIGDMGASLASVASVARQVGISLTDTVALLTLLAKNGIQGAAGGTVLRVALLRLVAPSVAAAKIIERLGLRIRDAQGNIRPQVFADFAKATENLTAKQRDADAAIVFGTRGIRAQAILGREGAAALNEMALAVEKQGTAAAVAGARNAGFTGKMENLKNQAEALGLVLGQVSIGPLGLFIDALADTASGLAATTEAMRDLIQSAKDLGQPFADSVPFLDKAESSLSKIVKLGVRAQLLGPGLFAASLAAEQFGNKTEEASGKVSVFDSVVKSVQKSLDDLTFSLRAAGRQAGQAGQALAQGLDVQIAVAETSGSDSRVLGLLRQKEAKQQAFLDRMLARPQTKSVQKTVEQAAQNLKQTQDQIQSILNTQAADAERAAADITQAKNKADQALLNALGGAQTRAQDQILRAQATKSLKDDIRFAVQFRNTLRKQIEIVRAQVKDAQTRATELRSLTTQLIKANADIRNLRQQARDAARQDRADRLARQDESVQLDIELAQITGNRQAEIRAHNARIKLLQQRIKNAQGNRLEIKRLKVEIAREKAAIRELKGEVDDRGRAFKELTFSFLQTQQGFAANLLGNLIPGGLTGGLVGNASSAGAGAIALGVPQFNEDPTRGLDKESKVAAGRDQGVSSGQGSTQIQLLRGILRALQALNGRTQHPEATYQRGVGRSTMDTFGV